MMKHSEARTVVHNVDRVINLLIGLKAYRVTQYVSPDVVISAVRRGAKKRIDKRDKPIIIALKIGAPNYNQRQFLKRCKKAGTKTGTQIAMPIPSKKG